MAKIVSSTPLNIKNCGNGEMGNSCKENELKSPYHLRSRMTNKITSMKENVCSTPNKVDNRQDSNITNCIHENTNSPQKNLSSNQKEILLKSPLFKSPVYKRSDKSIRVDTCKKRTISLNSDNDTFKLELYNTENFNSFESIDLLHDLDSTIKFENTENTFLTSMMDVSTMQEGDSQSGFNKDPATDPLSISDCEKKNNDSKLNKKQNQSRIEKISKPQIRRRSERLKQQKCSTDELNIDKSNTDEKDPFEKLKNIEEQEEVPLSSIKKLMELHIKLTHKVPPQHKIELSGAHAPTMREKVLFQEHGPIRKGLYTPTEDNVIRRNWEAFCELHDWDAKNAELFLYWRHKERYYVQDVYERQKFVQFLANGLPWRTLYSVYSRFKKLYNNKITRRRYSSKEDKKILMYVENKHLDKRNTKYTELAKILRRTSRSIFKRYQYLKNQSLNNSETELLVDVKWTLPLIKKFIKILLNVTLCEDIRELKDAMLPKAVWQKMEKNLNIHHNVLRTFWQHQLHLQLFSRGPIYLNDIKIQLIEYMYSKGISNTREIIWPNVAKHFDGATAVFLCKIFFYLIQECNIRDTNNFSDIVEYLYHVKFPEIVKSPTDKFLPKIIYENGKISLLNEKETITTDIEHKETDI